MSHLVAESALSSPQLENCIGNFFAASWDLIHVFHLGSTEKVPDFSWTHNNEKVWSVKTEKYIYDGLLWKVESPWIDVHSRST